MSVIIDTVLLDQMIATNPRKLADVVGKTAFRILEQARMITPRDLARPPVDTSPQVSGGLRADSNVVNVDALGLTRRIEYYKEYALAQEMGVPVGYSKARPWMFIPARPYLTPSVEKAAKQFFSDIGKAIES
jgi:hypothetical protein